MMKAVARNKMRIVSMLFSVFVALAPLSASAQEEPVEVTHGGYGAFGGGLAFSLLGGGLSAAAILIYAKKADCRNRPEGCKRTVGEHVLVGTLAVAGIAGIAVAGWGSQKVAEKYDWNPDTGWMLGGAYLGVPATLLLQNAIPKWEREWTRDVVGGALGVGGGIGAAYAFRAIARDRGHAWPEFGFGAGGMGLGLLVGQLVAKNSVWVPILGGVGAVLGASAATLAF